MNIYESGKNQALALSILKRILDNINPNRSVGVLYDIGCSLDKFMKLVSTLLLFGPFFTNCSDIGPFHLSDISSRSMKVVYHLELLSFMLLYTNGLVNFDITRVTTLDGAYLMASQWSDYGRLSLLKSAL
jgi:hypothetical protein